MITEKDFSGKDCVYIGDAVYASCDGYHIWLETTDGLKITNRVALCPHVLDEFLRYLKSRELWR